MEEYYFLFISAFIYTAIASIQDLKTREVPNWLNFSFIALGLSYRAFYSLYVKDYHFFLFGILGVICFFALANLFYYTKVFAGGDAKLLIGFGAIFPIMQYWDLLFVSLGFILLLFAVGAVYSLIYSVFLALKNYYLFRSKFIIRLKKGKYLFLISLIAIALFVLEVNYFKSSYYLLFSTAIFLLLIPFLYIYLKALEESCLIKEVRAKELTEGDWLENDVKVGNKFIRKSVHGLSLEEIKLLKKYNKKVIVRYGIPFIPAFFIAFVLMALFYSFSMVDFSSLIASLF